MKKISSLFLGFFVCFGLTTPVHGSIYPITGTNVKSPSQEQIVQFYDNYDIDPARNSDTRYSVNPFLPYESGFLDNQHLYYALNSLNYVRYIAGLNYNVVLDSDYTQMAQDASLLLAVLDVSKKDEEGNTLGLTHEPPMPESWDDSQYASLYDSAYLGANKSNIASYYLSSGSSRNLTNFLFYQWMADEDSANLSTVGHRRWVLNPTLGATGFGVVQNSDSYYTYSAMYTGDTSNASASNTTGVMWPAQNMPVDLFKNDYPWTYSSGSSIDSSAKVTVTLTRLNDNMVWTFGGEETDLNGDYLNVDNNYAQQGCVIFRPDPETIEYEHGQVYHVSIKGGVEASYVVSFFDINEINAGTGLLTPSNTPTTYTYEDGGGSVVTSIALNYSHLSFVQGEYRTVNASLSPSTATNQTILWSTSDSKVAIVDSNGKVTGVSAGSCTLTATVGSVSSTIPITILQTSSEIPVTGITLSAQSLDVPLGDGVRVSATIQPSNATEQTITWSVSDPSIASVDSTGRVFGLSNGSCFLTATVDGLSTTIPITVRNFTIIPITSVELSTNNLNLGVGQAEKIYVTVSPANATYQAVSWAISDEEVATVDSSGIVTATGVGGCYLTVTVGDFSKSIPIQVTALDGIIYPTNITLNYTEFTLQSGESQVVTAIVYPSNTTNQNVNWSTSNSTIATVNSSGRVTAVGSGTAYITATVGSVSKSVEVNVDGIADETTVSNIVLNYSNFSLPVGGEETIQATIYPSTASVSSSSWYSTDTSVATVSSSGLVTARGVGTADIIVTADHVSVICTVSVHDYETVVQVVGLSHKTLSLELWDQITLYTTVLPQNAVFPQISWHSSNPNAVTVDDSGTLSAIGSGSSTITASTSNGVYSRCEVTVSAPNYAARFQLIQDVLVEDWYYYYVKSVYYMGFMSGMSETSFAPNGIATRSMIAMTLYALEGKPAMEPESIFNDVPFTSYYADAVNWAKKAGIVSGITETTFAPESPVTREQLATILYNYEIYSGNISAPSGSYLTFKDSSMISNWATNATSWCVDFNIMRGDSNGYFYPNNLATRAEFATVLFSLINLY